MPTLLTLVPNLLFASGVNNAARAVGLAVRSCRDAATFAAALQGGERPIGAVVDLGTGNDWAAAIGAAHAATIPVFAFGPHLDRAALKGARAAGAGRVVANSALAAELPKWLARLADNAPELEEQPDDND